MLLQSRKKDLKSTYVVLVFNANSATCTFFSDFSPQWFPSLMVSQNYIVKPGYFLSLEP